MKGYIARDCGGCLYLYDEYPKIDRKWGDTYYAESGNSILLCPYRFGSATGWEKFDKVDFGEPIEVEITRWYSDIKPNEISIID